MKERPLLFKAEMVRATLDGRKTQTRRVMKLQPDEDGLARLAGQWLWHDTSGREYRCPYGRPGDRLWVRETWQYSNWTEDGYPFIRYRSSESDGRDRLCEKIPEEWSDRLLDIWTELSSSGNYEIDSRAADRRWRPAIHMPRWASRILLEITDIRIERVQDISNIDAESEGVECHEMSPRGFRDHFRELWESINADRGYGWDKNPWVWVICFQRKS